jgi:hypothetical protein
VLPPPINDVDTRRWDLHTVRQQCPRWILWVARIFPVKHFADGMQAGFLGTAFHWTDVLVVAAWGLAGPVLAMRFFSWEPRKS